MQTVYLSFLNKTGRRPTARKPVSFEKGRAFEGFPSYSVNLNREFSNKISIISCMRWFPWVLFFLCGLVVSCVSLHFKLPQDQKAEGVVFQTPPPPYQKTTKKGMDFAYENSQNKSIIAFFSNCSASTRWIALTEFQKDLLDSLNFQVKTHRETTHQNQKAFRISLTKNQERAKGKAPQQMELLLFKKETCFYALSFLHPHLTEGLGDFTHFIKEFKAP